MNYWIIVRKSCCYRKPAQSDLRFPALRLFPTWLRIWWFHYIYLSEQLVMPLCCGELVDLWTEHLFLFTYRPTFDSLQKSAGVPGQKNTHVPRNVRRGLAFASSADASLERRSIWPQPDMCALLEARMVGCPKRRARFGTLPRLLSMESGLTWIPDHNPLLLPLAPGRWLAHGPPPVERWREPPFRCALITAQTSCYLILTSPAEWFISYWFKHSHKLICTPQSLIVAWPLMHQNMSIAHKKMKQI